MLYVGQTVFSMVDYLITIFRNANGSFNSFQRSYYNDAKVDDKLNPELSSFELEIYYALIHRLLSEQYLDLITAPMITNYKTLGKFNLIKK